jgi:hypothetical protein
MVRRESRLIDLGQGVNTGSNWRNRVSVHATLNLAGHFAVLNDEDGLPAGRQITDPGVIRWTAHNRLAVGRHGGAARKRERHGIALQRVEVDPCKVD